MSIHPTTPAVEPPPERFNFAAHLIATNAGRADKTAYIDDQGSLSYGALAETPFAVGRPLGFMLAQPVASP